MDAKISSHTLGKVTVTDALNVPRDMVPSRSPFAHKW
jgi:hypothetical protein